MKERKKKKEKKGKREGGKDRIVRSYEVKERERKEEKGLA
jgi:hypothetical protein